MNRNMFTRNGVSDIISRFKKLFQQSKLIKSLKFRIFIVLMLIGIIPMIISRKGILSNYETHAVQVRTLEVLNQCKILANYLASSGYLLNTSLETINGELEQLSNLYDGRILVIDNNFKIIKDTYAISESKTIISEEVMKCFNGESGSNYDHVNQYIEVTIPIISTEDNSIIGVMLTSVSTDSIVDSIDILRRKAMIMEITMGIMIFVISILGAASLVKPFEKITSAIQGVKEGFGQQEILIEGYTEMESIMDAFNQLLARMKVLNDSRQEFVSNVSHELKTPLASMKVLADSLITEESAPIEMYREFMLDIAEEIDRENKIITDLLSLVKMDKTAGTLNIETVNINELMELILRRLRPIAAKSNIEVVFESIRPVEAEIDEVKLTLAFSNLVENAIKYNHEDGWVKVTLDADHQFFTLTVSDSGIGIPEESYDHIFERFYRVDKSHSREIGGTGLGLAITRNAILIHRGAIKVSSVENEGTTFTVKIPLSYIA